MKKASFKLRSSLVVACVACLTVVGSAPEADAQIRRITVGSNPAGTNYYAVASGVAKVLQDVTGVPSTVRPFSGSSVYIPMLQRGEVTMGINTQMDIFVAYSGGEPYGVPMSNLRLLMSLVPLADNYVTRANSGFDTVADLEGQRVVVAIRSNVTLELWHWGLLASGGLRPDDVDEITVASLPDAVRLLTEGRADAVPIGLDTALVRQADATIPGGVRYLSVEADEQSLLDVLPGSRVEDIGPDSGSVGILEPTRIGVFDSYLNTGTHVADDDAYLIVKTLYENWSTLRRDYPLLRDVPVESLAPSTTPYPYHSGAVRYYREAGAWTEAHELNQQQALAVNDP